MSSTTKRWMQEELQQLLQQRHRYKLAEATARDPAQARRRTQRLTVIDEEILGRREALDGLIEEPPPPAPRHRPPTMSLRRPATTRMAPIGASLAVMQPAPSFRVALAKTVGSSFAAGFLITAAFLWSAIPVSSTATARAPVAAPATAVEASPVRVTASIDRASSRDRNPTRRSIVRDDDAVLTATAKRTR
jgi:hypothetical protein